MIWPPGRSTELSNCLWTGPRAAHEMRRSATHPGNFRPGEPSSAEREDNPAADLAAAQFFEDVVRLSERAGGDLAANFPRRGHGEDLAQVLARAHGGGLNTNFARGHQDRRKTNIVGGQPDTEKSPAGSHAIECHAVRHFRSGSHKCHMDAIQPPCKCGPKGYYWSGLHASKEKLDGATHSLGQFMGAREIHRPLTC